MKKLLLLTVGGLVATSSFALEEPKVFENVAWQAISPNGKYLVSNIQSNLTIVNLKDSVTYNYVYDDTYSYAIGVGNVVSNDGVVLCANTYDTPATYWFNGEWFELETPIEGFTSINGITPDGSRIVGVISTSASDSDDFSISYAPAYWDRNPDSTYSTYHILPHPSTDFLGAPPQYVTAAEISADGKTIVGQVQSNSGVYHQPIVYKQDDDGNWTYTLLMQDKFTLEDIPAFPGDSPLYPEATDYLDEESLAAYNAQMAKYWETWDDADYPNATDYMTDEARLKYEADKAKYEEEYKAWAILAGPYEEFMQTLDRRVPAIELNNARISPDGSKIVMSQTISYYSSPDAWWPDSTSIAPIVIDVNTDSVASLDFGKTMVVVQVLNDGTYLAYNGIDSDPMTGYIVKDGVCTDLYDYIRELSPELKSWAETNLVHEKQFYDLDTDSIYSIDVPYTGMPVVSADMSTIAFWCQTASWHDYAFSMGYVIQLGGNETEGVHSIEVARDGEIAIDAAGNLLLGEDIANASVYDLSGRQVTSHSLNKGVYIVRAQRLDGTVISAKVCK